MPDPTPKADHAPSKIAQLVASILGDQTASTGAPPVHGRGTGYDPRNAATNIAMLKDKAPMIVGMGLAPFTEGLSIPASMALLGGASGATALATGHSPAEAALSAATNGAPSVLRAIGPATSAIARRGAGSLSEDVGPLAQRIAAKVSQMLHSDAPLADEAAHAPMLDIHQQPIRSPGTLFRNADEAVPSALPPNTGGPLVEAVRTPPRRGVGPIIKGK